MIFFGKVGISEVGGIAASTFLCAADEDVVDGDVDYKVSLALASSRSFLPCVFLSFLNNWRSVVVRTQLDNVTDNAHDEETDTDGLADLEEFALVGLTANQG